jgi:N-acetylglucosaminyldiphosphoundecaprenol N-acetyl-beta-D-mannosaminyltransferase
MPLATIDSGALLEHIADACEAGRGGWVVTANLDILQTFVSREDDRTAYLAADVRVADGMPLVWAATVQGQPLPERIAGATLSLALIERAAARGWPVLLLGGAPGSAERAAARLGQTHPELMVVARSDLQFADPPSREQVAVALELSKSQGSRIVLVGLGSPKQELVIQHLREELSDAWFVGVGGTFGFMAGDVPRAPAALQRVGLEWAHRLAQDPRRLAYRYLVRNLPFMMRVLTQSAWQRWSSSRAGVRE